MPDETSISPLSAAKMADAAYALKENTLAEATAITDFSFDNVATNQAENRKGLEAKTGAFGHKPSSGFGFCTESSDGHEAFIVTKGTSPCLADVLTDLNAIPCSTGYGNIAARGFVKSFESMENQIDEFVTAGNYRTIHCIGHSLGGALATLVANKYSQSNNANIKLYTFGSPRVFFGLGDKLSNVDSYRVFNQGDTVPLLGPFPLMHYDRGISVGLGPWAPWTHAMATYKKECDGKSWETLRSTQKLGMLWETSIIDSSSPVLLMKLLRKVIHYAFVALGLAVATVGGVIYATYTAADILLRLLLQGMSKLSNWIVSLLKAMSKFVHNGWESAKAKASDTYYKSKGVIQYIIDQFLMKMKQLATTAIDHTRTLVTAGADSLRQVGTVVASSGGLPIVPLIHLL